MQDDTRCRGCYCRLTTPPATHPPIVLCPQCEKHCACSDCIATRKGIERINKQRKKGPTDDD